MGRLKELSGKKLIAQNKKNFVPVLPVLRVSDFVWIYILGIVLSHVICMHSKLRAAKVSQIYIYI